MSPQLSDLICSPIRSRSPRTVGRQGGRFDIMSMCMQIYVFRLCYSHVWSWTCWRCEFMIRLTSVLWMKPSKLQACHLQTCRKQGQGQEPKGANQYPTYSCTWNYVTNMALHPIWGQTASLPSPMAETVDHALDRPEPDYTTRPIPEGSIYSEAHCALRVKSLCWTIYLHFFCPIF